MALKTPNPAFEGTFLKWAFLCTVPFTLSLLGYFATQSKELALLIVASAVLAAGSLLYTMIVTGYSHDGLFRAKFMRGGDWGVVYWFHVVIVAMAFVGFSWFLLKVAITGAI